MMPLGVIDRCNSVWYRKSSVSCICKCKRRPFDSVVVFWPSHALTAKEVLKEENEE